LNYGCREIHAEYFCTAGEVSKERKKLGKRREGNTDATKYGRKLMKTLGLILPNNSSV
jgi:hypothetical protein